MRKANNQRGDGLLFLNRAKPAGKLPVITDRAEAVRALLKESARARSHFKVVPPEQRTCDGITYASLKEMNTHTGYQRLERAGEIRNLRRQVPFKLYVNGEFITTYYADHVFDDVKTGQTVVADSKGKRTQSFIIKKNLMRALLGINVVEI